MSRLIGTAAAGCRSRSDSKSAVAIRATTLSRTAWTVADRGACARSASSPTVSPGQASDSTRSPSWVAAVARSRPESDQERGVARDRPPGPGSRRCASSRSSATRATSSTNPCSMPPSSRSSPSASRGSIGAASAGRTTRWSGSGGCAWRRRPSSRTRGAAARSGLGRIGRVDGRAHVDQPPVALLRRRSRTACGAPAAAGGRAPGSRCPDRPSTGRGTASAGGARRRGPAPGTAGGARRRPPRRRRSGRRGARRRACPRPSRTAWVRPSAAILG